jgi:hypothetical protein
MPPDLRKNLPNFPRAEDEWVQIGLACEPKVRRPKLHNINSAIPLLLLIATSSSSNSASHYFEPSSFMVYGPANLAETGPQKKKEAHHFGA